jgi:hypothetical protein
MVCKGDDMVSVAPEGLISRQKGKVRFTLKSNIVNTTMTGCYSACPTIQRVIIPRSDLNYECPDYA